MNAELKPLTLDQAAADALTGFFSKESDDGLRLQVQGGGCAGFQYKLGIDHPADEDFVFESLGYKIIVDPESYEYVKGSAITYREELNAQGFDVENPQAESACGCGSSFVMKGTEPDCGV